MKIVDLTRKTALEVEPDDLLVIEDKEDTKSITVKDLSKYIHKECDIHAKRLINETLDNVIASLEAAKYVITKKKIYMLNTWIGSDSGNIQFTLFDMDANKWLTMDEIKALELPDEDENPIRKFDISVFLFFERCCVDAMDYEVLSFNEEHENPEEINAALYEADAGFIKAHFGGLKHNEISIIKHHDIKVKLQEDEDYTYEFITDMKSFANAVEFKKPVPDSPICCNCPLNKPADPEIPAEGT